MLAAVRAFFADLVTATAGVPRPGGPLREAFASIPRERFLGPGPWRVFTAAGYIEAPSDDPALVYQDVVVALDEKRGINNGQPSLHALCLAALNIQPGETVTHVGAGTGYYTAVIAHLTGPAGAVHAFEIDPQLAARAAENLVEWDQVTVHARSASEGTLPESDVIYVNAGSTGPLDVWLDALRPDGRLLFPMTPAQGAGGMLLMRRQPDGQFDARFLCQVMFIPCVGARDEESARGLTDAFHRGNFRAVKSLKRNTMPDQTCWFAGAGWWLSKAP
jgi:protein-L-isoaspartate(D-aspartate) O-methyltransferase